MYQHTYVCLYDDAINMGEYITSNDSATGELEEISNEVFFLLWYCQGVCVERLRNPQQRLARASITVEIRSGKLPDISLESFRHISLYFTCWVQWAVASDAPFAA